MFYTHARSALCRTEIVDQNIFENILINLHQFSSDRFCCLCHSKYFETLFNPEFMLNRFPFSKILKKELKNTFLH